jgi:hypothetical protein
VRGPAVEATAGSVDRPEWPQALAALRRAHGLRVRLGHVGTRLWSRLTRPDTERHELIRIRPA